MADGIVGLNGASGREPRPAEAFDLSVWNAGGAPGPPHAGDEFSASEIDLKAYLALAWSGRWIILAVTVIVVVAAVAWSMTRKEVYQAKATISIDSRPPQMTAGELVMGPWLWEHERYLSQQERVLTSYDLASRVVDRIGLVGNPELEGPGPTADRLLAMLNVRPVPEAGLLNLSMTGSKPEQVAEWLNLYIEEFIKFNIDSSWERTQQVYDVIRSQLEPLHGQLEDSQRNLTEFKERSDSLLAADQDKNVISEQVNTLTSEFAQAKAERIRLEARLGELRSLRTVGPIEVSSRQVLADSTVHSLREEYLRLEMEIQQKLRVYREGHPMIEDLRGRMAAVEAQVAGQIETIISSVESDHETAVRREQSLLDSIQQLRTEIIELSKQTMEYESLKRDYLSTKSFYEEMLARSKEAEIVGNVSFNPVRIIDRARPPRQRVSPLLGRTVPVSAIFGLFLGTGLVLLLDHLDRSVRTPEDVARHFGLDVFAVVPISKDLTRRSTMEVFQGLRTALLFAARDTSCQVLLVTSAGPEEGKSTTVFMLARVLAAAGSRVLVLDGDLRKPSLHRLADVGRGAGFTDVVLGERTLEEVVHAIDGLPKLDVVTSGTLPPNPPELFGKVAFARLLEEARTIYDWILIDSPPVVSVTDAAVCSTVADMVLLVIQYHRLDRKVIRGALHQLARAGARIPGVVLNKVDLTRKDYYYDTHYYSYFYGYYEDGKTPSGKQGEGDGAGPEAR